jgi:hypothetical protein
MKVTHLHVARDGVVLGHFTIPAIIAQLDSHALDGNEWAWHEGITEWQPLRTLLPQQLSGDATDKQRSFLRELGVECPASLTKASAATMIQEALDRKKIQNLRESLWEEYEDTRKSMNEEGTRIGPKLTKREFKQVLAKLDGVDPSWDRGATDVNTLLWDCLIPAFETFEL